MKSELIKEIKDEVKVIYDVDVTEEVVSDFISWYFKRQKNPVFAPMAAGAPSRAGRGRLSYRRLQ